MSWHKPERFKSPYSEASYVHAFLLRCEGMTYKEIGRHLGIHKQWARIKVRVMAGKLNWATRKCRWTIN